MKSIRLVSTTLSAGWFVKNPNHLRPEPSTILRSNKPKQNLRTPNAGPASKTQLLRIQTLRFMSYVVDWPGKMSLPPGAFQKWFGISVGVLLYIFLLSGEEGYRRCSEMFGSGRRYNSRSV